MTRVQVHLTTWALDDGAVEPFDVGDRVELEPHRVDGLDHLVDLEFDPL